VAERRDRAAGQSDEQEHRPSTDVGELTAKRRSDRVCQANASRAVSLPDGPLRGAGSSATRQKCVGLEGLLRQVREALAAPFGPA